MIKLMIGLVMVLVSTQAYSEDYKTAYYDSTVEVAKLLRYNTILENFVGEQYMEIKLLNAQLESMKELNKEALHSQIALGEFCSVYAEGEENE